MAGSQDGRLSVRMGYLEPQIRMHDIGGVLPGIFPYIARRHGEKTLPSRNAVGF